MQPRATHNPAKEELLGRQVTIESSTDPTMVGLTGEVLDETMKTLTLRTGNGGTVMVAKDTATLAFYLEGRRVEVDGRTLMFRPEDRIKKVRQGRTREESR